MDGTLVPMDCSHLRRARRADRQSRPRCAAAGDRRLRDRLRSWTTRRTTVQPGRAGAAQRGPPLRSERAALQPVPRPRPAVFLRLFRRAATRRWRRRSPPRSATSPPSCCSTGPDSAVLDIGCGWGGMALTLAREYGARVPGITLSTEQLAEARGAGRGGGPGRPGALRADGLSRRCNRRFDRIVSVGMFEHVGVAHYRAFSTPCKRCLAPDGVALLHSIGRREPPGGDQCVARQIHLPRRLLRRRLSEVLPHDRARGPVGDRHRDPAAALRATRCATGAGASPPTATRSRRSTTSGSAGCGSSTWPARSCRSATAAR